MWSCTQKSEERKAFACIRRTATEGLPSTDYSAAQRMTLCPHSASGRQSGLKSWAAHGGTTAAWDNRLLWKGLAHAGPLRRASERAKDWGKGSGGAGESNGVQKTALHIQGSLSTRSPGKDLQFLKRKQGLPPWQGGMQRQCQDCCSCLPERIQTRPSASFSRAS